MRRGDLITVALKGEFGKPRPALVVQSDDAPHTASVTVLLLTSTLHEDTPLVRQTVEPTAANGLRAVSQVQIDRTMSVPRDKVGPVIGRLDDDTMAAVTRLLALFLGIAN